MIENKLAHNSTSSDQGFCDLYNKFFTPAQNATGGNHSSTAMSFEIFTLTKNSMPLVYSNNSK